MMSNVAERPGAALMESVDRWVGRRIAEVRADRGVTQRQLAKRIGVTFSTIFKYEHGMNRISVSQLCMVAQALDCFPGYLLCGLDEYVEMVDIDFHGMDK